MEMKERAMQCYMALLSAAHNRQTLTYEILGGMVGLPARALAEPLGYIMVYCSNHNLPPLTVLVVQKHTGIPSEGLVTSDPKDFDGDRERVFTHEWYKTTPITSDDLATEWKKAQQLRNINA